MSETEAVARDEFFESLLGDFLDESGQLLDRLNENLLQLDDWARSLGTDHRQRCDEELMNEMFRSAHSLKGLSAMLGLSDINDLTHKVENVFDAARKDELIITSDCVELMFRAVDRLVAMVEVLKEPDGGTVDCGGVAEDIRALLQAAGVERARSSQDDAERALAEVEAGIAALDAHTPTRVGGVSSSESGDASVAPDTATLIDPFAGIENEDEISVKYLGIFIDETDLALDSLTETLLNLEGGGNRESLENLLVTSHRIKGSAASIGLNRAAKLAHLMEDQLQNLVEIGGTLSPELTDAMLRATDGLRSFLERLKSGQFDGDQFSRLAAGLLAAQDPRSGEQVSTQSLPEPTAAPPTNRSLAERSETITLDDSLRRRLAVQIPDGARGYFGGLRFQSGLPLVGLKAELIHEKLGSLGTILHFDPPPDSLDELEALEQVIFAVISDHDEPHVLRQLRIAGVEEISIEPIGGRGEAEAGASGSDSRQEIRPADKAVPCQPLGPPPAEESAGGGCSKAGESPGRKQPAPSSRKDRAAEPGSRPAETLRVDIDRLDQLMNLAGQLVINRARFIQIGDSMKSCLGSKQSVQTVGSVFATLEKIAAGSSESTADRAQVQAELDAIRSQARRMQAELESVRRDVEALAGIRSSINELGEAIHQLGRVSDGIQQSVMDTRMVPIGPLFARFKRVIRDITRTNGKSIRLIINGEKTELDKRMIDELGDPLIHMVRNAADHGIELPEERAAKGKPTEGTVTLDAFHRGNSIVIEVTDDGKGLDPDRILRKALDKGIVSDADAEKMTPHQIYQLIWEPGLSTAEKVTEVSGRGMGMDIVKSKIEEINGTVDLDSTPGKGTKLTIKLPLTLAILPSLLVEIDGDVFAMPMESVVEIVSVGRKDLTTIHGVWAAQVRGRVISMVRLDEVLSWNRAPKAKGSASGETTLVVLGETGKEIGLPVDRVLGEEDVVIKSMAENYRNVAGIAGASILGDGRVSLILDTAALIDLSSQQPGSSRN